MTTGKKIEKAVALGKKLQQVFVATADKNGLSHIAAAGDISREEDRRVTVAACYCPRTVDNLHHNRMISIVVWEPLADRGYQLSGEVEQIEESAEPDGYAPKLKAKASLSKKECKLVVHVDRVIPFSQGPRSFQGEQTAAETLSM